ncbi:MAG TPA: 2'-5' RNA ligase family protein [Polyangiaceae bacterium]|nr:2'-5' RNA ligase family protein [Polyangiaceae bacterium]
MQRSAGPVAFWLVPSEPIRAVLSTCIESFASKYTAPAFTPHVTLMTGHCSEPVSTQSCERVLARAAEGSPPFEVRVSGASHSDFFFKTVFLEIAPDDALTALRERVRAEFEAAGGIISDKPFEPHLSLIYKRASEAERHEIVSEVVAPEVIVCDALAVVVPSSAGWEDVAAWRELRREPLGG